MHLFFVGHVKGSNFGPAKSTTTLLKYLCEGYWRSLGRALSDVFTRIRGKGPFPGTIFKSGLGEYLKKVNALNYFNL